MLCGPVVGQGESDGQMAEGIWLLGYDPFAKVYECIAVCGGAGTWSTFTGERRVQLEEGEV